MNELIQLIDKRIRYANDWCDLRYRDGLTSVEAGAKLGDVRCQHVLEVDKKKRRSDILKAFYVE